MLSKQTLLLSLLSILATATCSEHYRRTRGSAGAYSGVSNGQYYGGTYHQPDNGPPVVNRFGEHPPPSSGHFGPGGASFAGAGAGAGTYAPQYPFVNLPPFQAPVDFNNFFQSYFKLLNDNLAAAARRNTSHLVSSSKASFSFTDPPSAKEDKGAFAQNFAYQQTAFDAAQNAFKATTDNRFGPGHYAHGASASASFGPGGGHQSANVYPENPGNPNIHSRFGSSGPKPGGVYGVSSSSFSGSSDIGGKRTSYKEASTTINDNGKVRTYTVRN